MIRGENIRTVRVFPAEAKIPTEVVSKDTMAFVAEQLGTRVANALIAKLNDIHREAIVSLSRINTKQDDQYYTIYRQEMVVEDLVRCKDCLYWEAETPTFGVCPGSLGTHSEDYCSRGRRTDETD